MNVLVTCEDRGMERLPSYFRDRIRIDEETGCWEWAGPRLASGYGMSRTPGYRTTAHRAVYLILVGPLPEGWTPDHLCRNKGCVNPDHVEGVPHGVNVRRAEPYIDRARNGDSCRRGHSYTPENTRYDARGYRVCRACKREQSRESMRRQRAGRAKPRDLDRCKRGHPLTPENTYVYPNGRRRCRECQKVHG